MKAVTIAAALNEKVVKPTDQYNDVGYAIVGGRRLNNALGKAYGPTTVTGILERSLNAGAAWVGQKLGAQRLSDYFSRFGFGKPTGVDLAGEVTGTVRPLAEWYPVDVGTASFGQGVSVSPLQLAMAYAALANGGTLFRPYVVASRRDADGEHRTAPVAVDQVVRPPRCCATCSWPPSTTASRTTRRSPDSASRGRPAQHRSLARMAATSTIST
jgi:stage V sporulation protein D (sporulation-specific penicillin-binding protein)